MRHFSSLTCCIFSFWNIRPLFRRKIIIIYIARRSYLTIFGLTLYRNERLSFSRLTGSQYAFYEGERRLKVKMMKFEERFVNRLGGMRRLWGASMLSCALTLYLRYLIYANIGYTGGLRGGGCLVFTYHIVERWGALNSLSQWQWLFTLEAYSTHRCLQDLFRYTEFIRRNLQLYILRSTIDPKRDLFIFFRIFLCINNESLY